MSWTARTVLLILSLTVISKVYLDYHPGGSKNPHAWISEVIARPSAQDITDYEQCKLREKETRGLAFCVDPFASARFMPMEIRLTKNHRDYCWNIDFCTRHSEVRVTPCKP